MNIFRRAKKPKKIIEEIQKDHKEIYQKKEVKGLLRLVKNIHSSSTYIAELLQNAIDADAKKIHFEIEKDGEMYLEHDGKSFEKDDVKSLSSAGFSNKLASNIGFMGIGFKAVYERFQKAAISSPPWKFYYECPYENTGKKRIVKMTIPHWDESLRAPKKGMSCRFEFSKPSIDKEEDDYKKIIEKDFKIVMGENNNLLVMMAVHGVKEIKWGDDLWLLECEEILLEYEGVKAKKIRAISDSEELNWIHFSKEYSLTEEAIKVFINHRSVSEESFQEEKTRTVEAFALIDKEGFPKLKQQGKGFAVLPMGVDLPIGLNLQADWLVNVDRSEPLEFNVWHKLIIKQVPDLIAAFLKWTTTFGNGSSKIKKYYRCFPVFDKNMDLEEWFESHIFLNKLKESLRELKFISVKVEDNIDYISPEQGFLLPDCFNKLKNDKFKSWILLGNNYVFRDAFPSRALKLINKLDLIEEANLKQLLDYWDKNVIKNWSNSLKNNKNEGLLYFYSALNEHKNNIEEISNRLRCFPTEKGDWKTLSEIKAVAREWSNFFGENKNLSNDIMEKLIDEHNILELKLWKYIQRHKRDENINLNRLLNNTYLKIFEMEEALYIWWNTLPEEPDQRLINHVLNLTYKAFPNRHNLIMKVICQEQNNEKKKLVNVANSLLSNPYASSKRKKIFSDLPAIDKIYYEKAPEDSSIDDWRSFFQKFSPQPKGAFKFRYDVEKIETRKGRAEFGYPETRVSPMTEKWRINDSEYEIEIDNDHYFLIRPKFPDIWPNTLDYEMTYSEASLFSDWLAESAESLKSNKDVFVAYIRYDSSYIAKYIIENEEPGWISLLKNQKWVPVRDEKIVLSPEKVLGSRDPARPEAYVADLREELIINLEQCGIEFGKDIPKVPVLKRLKKSGNSLNTEELIDKLKQAVDKAEDDDEVKEELIEIIKNELKLPGPNRKKMPYHRYVKKDTDDIKLGSYFVSYNKLAEEIAGKEVLKLVDKIIPFPEKITEAQLLEYFKHIWSARPEPNEIKDELIYAYDRINKILSDDPSFRKKWEEILENGKVYVRDGEWKYIRENEGKIFFEDYSSLYFKRKLILLEDSLLGKDEESKIKTANNHGIPSLNDKFDINIDHKAKVRLREWEENLTLIKDLVEDNFDNDINMIKILFCRELKLVIEYENEVWLQIEEKVAENSGEFYITTKEITDIARNFAKKLMDFWDLRSEQNFICDLSFLIPYLNNREQLIKEINKIREELDLKSIQDDLEETVSEEASKKHSREDEEVSRSEKEAADSDLFKEPVKSSGRKSKSEERDESRLTNKKEETSDKIYREERTSQRIKSSKKREVKSQEESRKPSRESLKKEKKDYNVGRREAVLENLIKNIEKVLDMETLPDELNDIYANNVKEENKFLSDKKYRQKAIEYENYAGRFPEEKSANQKGYDIISYDDPDKERISRYIEVKGIEAKWDGEKEVALSRRQLLEASEVAKNKGEEEYWIYVVEKENDSYNVIPILNPVEKAGVFIMKGKHWRWLKKIQK